MNEKKAKRLRRERRAVNRINTQILWLRYQDALLKWKMSEPPKYRIFKWLKWRRSKPKMWRS